VLLEFNNIWADLTIYSAVAITAQRLKNFESFQRNSGMYSGVTRLDVYSPHNFYDRVVVIFVIEFYATSQR